jgi:hypothetical protein
MEVRFNKVKAAFDWLVKHNPAYAKYKQTDEEVRRRVNSVVMIDSTTEEPSEDTNLEQCFEYHVAFPDGEEVTRTNGGHSNQQEFQEAVLGDLADPNTNVTMVARPSTERLKEYEGNNLLVCFPLQFPYGIGAKPDKKVSYEDYYRYLMSLPHPAFHHPEFVLVIHNLYERSQATRTVFLKCKTKQGGSSIGEYLSQLTVDDLQAAAERRRSGAASFATPGDKLLSAMTAVCRSMAHTNEAAQHARTRMFAMCSMFGLPSLFFTVTPEDACNLRIKVMALQECQSPSYNPLDPRKMPPDKVEEEVKELFSFRQHFPGLCAFDFDQISNLVIDWIIGWDQSEGAMKETGGAFGRTKAWCAAVEEQGRKTLHAHYLIWLEGWSELREQLYSSDPEVRATAGDELASFVDHVVSTKLHADMDESRSTMHYCKPHDQSKPANLEFCSEQDLRNLRYKAGVSSLGDRAIARCKDCETTFSSEDLAENLLTSLRAGGDRAREGRMDLFLMKENSGFGQEINESWGLRCTQRNAITTVKRNLHASGHCLSCWKKGSYCRMCQPCRAAAKTMVHFYDDDKLKWARWNGPVDEHAPFFVEPKRDPRDVFVNPHHKETSLCLGCNTNVQCGVDGGHIMYCTCYTGKSNQKEETERFQKVVTAIKNMLRREQREREERAAETSGGMEETTESSTVDEEGPSPISVGF